MLELIKTSHIRPALRTHYFDFSHHTLRSSMFVKASELGDKVSQRQDASTATTLWWLVAPCAGQAKVFTGESDSTAFVIGSVCG